MSGRDTPSRRIASSRLSQTMQFVKREPESWQSSPLPSLAKIVEFIRSGAAPARQYTPPPRPDPAEFPVTVELVIVGDETVARDTSSQEKESLALFGVGRRVGQSSRCRVPRHPHARDGRRFLPGNHDAPASRRAGDGQGGEPGSRSQAQDGTAERGLVRSPLHEC